jgi:hypothetical protein
MLRRVAKGEICERVKIRESSSCLPPKWCDCPGRLGKLNWTCGAFFFFFFFFLNQFDVRCLVPCLSPLPTLLRTTVLSFKLSSNLRSLSSRPQGLKLKLGRRGRLAPSLPLWVHYLTWRLDAPPALPLPHPHLHPTFPPLPEQMTLDKLDPRRHVTISASPVSISPCLQLSPLALS